MGLTPLPSNIGWGSGSNPQSSNRESSALPLDHSFRLSKLNQGFKYPKYFMRLIILGMFLYIDPLNLKALEWKRNQKIIENKYLLF